MLKLFKKIIRQQASYIKRDQPALLTFLFHSIFKDETEITKHHIDPQQHITVEVFEEFTKLFLEAGYKFIAPNQLNNLKNDGKYILTTFDDGYFNNSLVIPILNKYKTPATFFITTNNVINNECFWWDIVYRERFKLGEIKKQISIQQKKYKNFTHKEIILDIKKLYGENSLKPVSDIDRPFTVLELQNFTKNEFVNIGNHTKNHYILDNYSKEEQQNQILSCQNKLNKILGNTENIIAYPNGNYNKDTLSVCNELGFEFGITVEKRKNHLPLNQDINSKLTLGRYVLWGNENIKRQCDIFRSGFSK